MKIGIKKILFYFILFYNLRAYFQLQDVPSTGAVEYTDCTSVEGYPPKKKNECPVYDTKQSDGEVPVMPELWGMRSTPSLPSLLGPL